MPSDYQKQLEEENWVLRNRLEQFENRCEWFEKLHYLKISAQWSIETTYQIGVNDYKSNMIQVASPYALPDDALICHIVELVNDSVIQSHVCWKNNADKVTIRHEYDRWKASMIEFIYLAKTIFDSASYKDINKLSITTNAYMGLGRFFSGIEETDKTGISMDFGNNDKYLQQGVTFTIQRGEKLPSCKITVKKRINCAPCNNKFRQFEKEMKALTNIYEAMEKLAQNEVDLENDRKKAWDVPN